MAESDKPVSAKQRYADLKTDRSDAETRAKSCARVTIPALWKEPKQKVAPQKPVQGTGARCVNALANQLLLATLPPNLTPFTLRPSPADSESLMEQANLEKGELEGALADLERAVMEEAEGPAALRAALAEAYKYAVNDGNFLLYIPDEGPSKFYPVNTFVVNRDGLGNILEVVTLDHIAIELLPDEVRNAILQDVPEAEKPKRLRETAELYTYVSRDESGENWVVFQEVEEHEVDDTRGTYPVDACPWIPVALARAPGDDYGRGLIEDYRGEFETLDALRKALRKGAAAAAKILWLLKPTSAMKPEQLTRAESGAVVRGNKADIEALTLDKFADLQFVRSEADTLARNLELVFGVGTAIQRSGERVTKEEIQYLARVLEDNRAGIYSVIGQELMLPIVRRLLARLQDAGAIPELPEGIIKPSIVVGTAALGRGHDFEKLIRFGDAAKTILGEQEFARRVDAGEWLSRLGAAADISTKGLVLDPDTVTQNDTNAAATEAAVRAAPNIANAAMAAQASPIQP